MVDALRDALGQIAAVALWTSATTGAMVLLVIGALTFGGVLGSSLIAFVPAASWGGQAMRRRVLGR